MNAKLYISILFFLFLIFPFIQLSAQEKSFRSDELLSMSLDELLNLKISTAGKIEQKLSDVPASVVLISRDEIEKVGYQSVEEILTNVPGFYLIDDYTWLGQKNYGVRGFFSTGQFDNVSVLINGISQKSTLLDSYPTEKFDVPVEAIDRIEIIRGPMSVMYGSGAFFGAINIITNDLDETDGNIFSGSVGNQGLNKLFAGLREKNENFKYSLYGSQYSDDGIDVPFSKMMSNASIVTKPVTAGGWNLDSDRTTKKLSTNRRHFSFNGNYKNLTIDFGMVHSRKNVFETIAGYGDGSWVNFNTSQFSVRYNKSLSDIISIESKFGYLNDYHWVDNEFYYKHSYTNNLLRSNSYELELLARITPNEDLSLVVGMYRNTIFDYIILADYVGLGYLPNLEITYDNDIVSGAFYAQSEYAISDKLKTVAGLRLERLNPYNFDLNLNFPEASTLGTNQPPTIIPGEFKPRRIFEFIPRLAVIYSITENHILKLLYGEAIKQPNPTSNLDVALNSSPQLKPAEIKTFELNYIASLSPKVLANFSVFRNKLDNLISRINILNDEGSIIVSTNAGKMTTTGVEANLQILPVSNLKIDMSVSYQNSKNQRKGFEQIDLEYAPKLLAYGKLLWDISDKISFSMAGRFVDKMHAGWNLDNLDNNNLPFVPVNDPLKGRLGYDVKSNFTVDSNLRINQLFNTGFYFNARFSNLFNSDVYYPTTPSNPMFDLGTMGRGRTFMITLGCKI